MPSIGLIDDSKDSAESLTVLLQDCLPKTWDVAPVEPFQRMDEYLEWRAADDVRVLLIDERLGDKKSAGIGHVPYKGHEVLEFLRKRLPTFPIFIFTAYKLDEELISRSGQAEEVFQRDDLNDNIGVWCKRFVRAGNRFAETHEQELAALSQLAARVASGEASRDDVKALHAKQAMLGLAFADFGAEPRSVVLKEIEGKLDDFSKLAAEINKHLKGRKKK